MILYIGNEIPRFEKVTKTMKQLFGLFLDKISEKNRLT